MCETALRRDRGLNFFATDLNQANVGFDRKASRLIGIRFGIRLVDFVAVTWKASSRNLMLFSGVVCILQVRLSFHAS